MSLDPVDLVPPGRALIPRPTNLLFSRPAARPRYVPGPLAEGAARVVLSDDYYLGPQFSTYDDRSPREPYEVFDIPAEQLARWEAAEAAYSLMQQEIGTLRSERRQ